MYSSNKKDIESKIYSTHKYRFKIVQKSMTKKSSKSRYYICLCYNKLKNNKQKTRLKSTEFIQNIIIITIIIII